MIFDDIVSDGDGKSAWTYVCEGHIASVESEYHGASEDSPIECTCGVEGCEAEADYYFTFYADNHLVVSI
jgi:hypothetical protein